MNEQNGFGFQPQQPQQPPRRPQPQFQPPYQQRQQNFPNNSANRNAVNNPYMASNNYGVNQVRYSANPNTNTTNKKPNTVIIVSVVAFILVFSIVVGSLGIHMNKLNEYHETLQNAVSEMYSNALLCESACVLIHDVWYNTIFEKDDITTDKYTKSSGGHYKSWSGYSEFNEDFNVSLRALFSDTSFKTKISCIETGDDTVTAYMSKLKDPPTKYAEQYKQVMQLYDYYSELYQCATNSSGTLTTYTETYNEADNNFAKQYKICKDY